MGLPNLSEFYEAVSDWVDEGKAVNIVYLDFKKAFDKVPHRKLLAKVRACGVAGQVANWIANWLSDRKQRVAVSGRMSCWEDASSRVPQGSVLGPLLFIIYINDLDNGVKSKLSKFANDTKLGGEVDSRVGSDQIQESIDSCIDWAKDWQMEFNLSQYKVLGMGKNNENRDYRMQGVILEHVTQEKDMGGGNTYGRKAGSTVLVSYR